MKDLVDGIPAQDTISFAMSKEDWRYSDQRMDVRTQGLNILLKKYGSQICSDGSPRYSNQSIYECVHDWVSQGNVNTNGIVKYYEAYYA